MKLVRITLIIYCLILFTTISFFTHLVFQKNTSILAITKTDKPQLSFFVMSFCPFSNQLETSLQSIFYLLPDQVNFTPHYLFKKTSHPQPGDLQSKDGTYYSSAQGRQEISQNVREICAWNQVGQNKNNWWKFVALVNQNCTVQNADVCWEEQGKAAGLDTNKITECFNKDAFNLIEKEISVSTQLKVDSSPTIFINDTLLPTTLNPETIKNDLCTSMKNPSKNCHTNLFKLDDLINLTGNCLN